MTQKLFGFHKNEYASRIDVQIKETLIALKNDLIFHTALSSQNSLANSENKAVLAIQWQYTYIIHYTYISSEELSTQFTWNRKWDFRFLLKKLISSWSSLQTEYVHSKSAMMVNRQGLPSFTENIHVDFYRTGVGSLAYKKSCIVCCRECNVTSNKKRCNKIGCLCACTFTYITC